VDFHLEGDDLLAATRSHVRGNGLTPTEDEDNFDSQAEDIQEAAPAPTTRLYDMTMHMSRHVVSSCRIAWSLGPVLPPVLLLPGCQLTTTLRLQSSIQDVTRQTLSVHGRAPLVWTLLISTGIRN